MIFDFGNFIAENWQDLLVLVFLFILSVVQIKKYGKVSKGVSETMANESKKIRTRLANYRLGISEEDKGGQSFNRIVPEYAYDEDTQELYVVGSKDLQAIVQSSVDCALDRILEKFGALPPEMQPAPVQSDEVNIVELNDDLVSAGEMFDQFEEIRQKYGFDDTLSYQDMFSKLDQMKADYDTQLKESIANKNKEIIDDEKKKNFTQA